MFLCRSRHIDLREKHVGRPQRPQKKYADLDLGPGEGGRPADNDRFGSATMIRPDHWSLYRWSLWSEGATAPFYKGVLTPERDWSVME